MLVTMLARSLCLTFHSPNQRNSQGWEGKKPASAGFLLAIYSMIQHLDPDRFYTNRSYLTEWFPEDTLVITDNDFENIQFTRALTSDKKYIIDITHNPWPDTHIPIPSTLTLTNNFQFWYQQQQGHVFFPLFLWMFSLKKSLWWPGFSFDAGNKKTQGIMCLNKNTREHRTWLWEEFTKRNLTDRMMYTFVGHRTLPDESPDPTRNDVGVGHQVYNQYAVNLVTETDINLPYTSEKTCKPFIARQIPIMVASAGVNRFLQDIGLDMFEDIVPWSTWDSETDNQVRMNKIVDFVEQWIRSGSILDDYNRVLPRVEKNKHYFHSEEFRNKIMNQINLI